MKAKRNETTLLVVSVAYLGLSALAGCTVTSTAGDAGSGEGPGSTPNGSSSGASSDDATASGDDGSATGTDGGAVPDATMSTTPAGGDAGVVLTATDGGFGGGCIHSISGQYIVRNDGLAVFEGTTETVVVDGTSGTMNTPLANVQSVSQYSLAACAVVAGGNVWCWQEDANSGNTSGQLGNGTTNPPSPVYHASKVLTAANTPLANVVGLASGVQANAACAITADHTMWCWGDLTWLANNGTTLIAPYAQQIKGTDGQSPLAGVVQAAIASANGCAVVSGSPANSLYCWGADNWKELGQGDTTNRQYPIKIPGLTNPTKVAMTVSYGNSQTICELDGDSVLCLGANYSGAAGSSGSTNPVPSATAVVTAAGPTLRGVTDLEAGSAAFAVLRNDGTIWQWGSANGSNAYASSNGMANVLALGWASDPRYVTSGGAYFNGTKAVTVNCGMFSQ